MSTEHGARSTEHGSGALWEGDCLERLQGIKDKSVDMILTDLPYGTTRNKWDEIIPFEPMWAELHRIAKPRAAMVFTATQPFTSALVMSNASRFRHAWVWEKTTVTGHLNAKKAPMRAHEDLLVFSTQPGAHYYPEKTTGHERKVSTAEHKRNSKKTPNWGEHGATSYDSTERYPRSVQKFSLDKQKSKLHSTQKPVDLFRYLIRTYSKPDETVLDIAAGSSTTAIAAIREGRRWLCIEKDAEAFDVSAKRIKQEMDAIR